MSEQPENTEQVADTATQDAEAKAKKSAMRLKMAALGGALFGMVFGAVVEMFVQGAMESTGYFGPTLDSMMEEQQSNFKSIEEKLAKLRSSGDSGERSQLEKELKSLLKEQQQSSEKLGDELRKSLAQIEALRADALAAQGAAKGADVWLKAGESISVATKQNVFSVVSIDPYRRAVINLNGKKSTLEVGEFVDAPAKDGNWRVFYRQSQRGDDRYQVGFDVVAPE